MRGREREPGHEASTKQETTHFNGLPPTTIYSIYAYHTK